MKRRTFLTDTLISCCGAFISVNSLEALLPNRNHEVILDQDPDSPDIFPAPDDPQLWDTWRNDLEDWRIKKQHQISYDGSSYRSSAFNWVTSNFACCFVMMCDSDFYDHNNNQYKIAELLDRGEKEFGGYDSVVLWHAYPRIGLDDRNQFDFYREMPHGLEGLRKIVRQFHDKGVKVFTNYNPWDTGTRREDSSDLDLLLKILQAIDADGIFLDTMKNAPHFRERLDALRPGIVMEGEIALPLEHVQTHHMSWAQWFRDSYAPGVYRNKWFERYHMQHAIARWDEDKSPQLQTAWMNGSGMLIWENIFGQWLNWSERDKSIYRSIIEIQRYFADIFSGEKWKPLAVESQIPGVFISEWEKDGIVLWTLINRNEYSVSGTLFRTIINEGSHLFNLIEGEKISVSQGSGQTDISGSIGGRGAGCFAAIHKEKISKSFYSLLETQKIKYKSLSDNTLNPVVQITILHGPDPARLKKIPSGMIAIPGFNQEFIMEYTFRECGGYISIQDHIKQASKNKLHTLFTFKKRAERGKYAIDEYPVTNRQYKQFLESSGYSPPVRENFLKHWINNDIPQGYAEHPVVYVSHQDAEAYAMWAGKRLPTEEEWQYAAQGPDNFLFPWGNIMLPGRCNTNLNGNTTSVRSFPEGKSPFGCHDMCGNIWELTATIYTEGKTRFVMLKGGSCYKAEGSDWYMDGGPQNNRHLAKMLLMYPGLDRCSTVGFRCAADL